MHPIPELTVLALAGLLQVLQITLMAIAANLELGFGKTLGPRDRERLGGDLESLASPGTQRLFRAMNNHFEGLILFGIAVGILVMGDRTSALTATLAWIYLGARVLYVPAYYFGWVPWRSLIWCVGLGATTLMLLLALVG